MKHRRHRRVEAKGVAGQVKTDVRGTACAIENISEGGLFLRTASPMPVGMPVKVDLSRPGLDEVIPVSGRVVSVVTSGEAARNGTVPGVGIELDPLPPDAEKRLHTLLRQLGLRDLAEPTEIEPGALHGTASPDTLQVANNVRGLLEMLTDALHKVKERDARIAELDAEVRRLKAGRR